MSAFNSGAAGFNAQVRRTNFDFNAPLAGGWWGADTTDLWEDAVLWPRSSMQGDARLLRMPTRWAPPPRKYGGQQMKKLQGITRDSAGAVLGGAEVHAFLTASDQFFRQVTSDAGGYFDLGSEYAGVNHYLVAYKAGSPDVAGTTVNTLQPT